MFMLPVMFRSYSKTPSLKKKQVNKNKWMADISKINIACKAGVGACAVGAGILRKKIEAENLSIQVTNIAINDLSEDVDLVITHDKMTEEAKIQAPNAHHISLSNFLDNKLYSSLVNNIKVATQ